MKLFKLKFRKFEKETTEIDAIETWCVKWISLKADSMSEYRYSSRKMWEVQAFTSEKNANIFAQELKDSMRLLNHRGWSVMVFKQIPRTNT